MCTFSSPNAFPAVAILQLLQLIQFTKIKSNLFLTSAHHLIIRFQHLDRGQVEHRYQTANTQDCTTRI